MRTANPLDFVIIKSMFECLFKWVLTDLLPEMSFVCDNYWSRDYHEDTGIRVLHSETRVVSVGIRAYLTVARAIGLDDRSRTLWITLSIYYTPLNYRILPLTHIPLILWLVLFPAPMKFLTKPFWIRRKWTRLTPERPWTLRSSDYHSEAVTK